MLHDAQEVLKSLHCIMGHCNKPELLERTKIEGKDEFFSAF